jgi:hypothetical protein
MSLGNQSPQRRVLFVLGMHQGGASAFARGVGALGVEFGERLMQTVPDQNAKGFWEDLDVVSLNDRVLVSLCRNWVRLEPIGAEVWRQPVLAALGGAEAMLRRRLDEQPRFRLARLLVVPEDAQGICRRDVVPDMA